jgi:hypothetical protein
MIETGTMNDNEIIVRRGLAKGDLVMLTPPANQAGIGTEKIAGLKPATTPATTTPATTTPAAPARPPVSASAAKTKG